MAFSIRLKILFLLGFVLALNTAQSQNLNEFSPYSEGVTEDILYESEFRYKDFLFTGLFAVKSETDGTHIYLMSKMGFTLVEAILKENETIWIKTAPFLEKNQLKKQLATDLRLLTQSPLKFGSIKKRTENGIKIKFNDGEKAFFKVENGAIVSAKTKGFLKPVKTKISYLGSSTNGVPNEIVMTKTLVDAEIKLQLHENK